MSSDTPHPRQQPPNVSAQVVADLARQLAEFYPKRKIEAIKLVRAHTGYGLKDSKDLIDAFWAETKHSSPQLTAPPFLQKLRDQGVLYPTPDAPERDQPAVTGCSPIALIVILILVAGAVYLFTR